MGKHTDIFREGDRILVLGVGFWGDNFPYGGKFLGVSFSGEILHWEVLSEFLYEISFYLSYFLFAYYSIVHMEMFQENCPGEIFNMTRYLRNNLHRSWMSKVIRKMTRTYDFSKWKYGKENSSIGKKLKSDFFFLHC